MGFPNENVAYKFYCDNPLKNAHLPQFFLENETYVKDALSKSVNIVDYSRRPVDINTYSDEELNLLYSILQMLEDYSELFEEYVLAGYDCEYSNVHYTAGRLIYKWGKRGIKTSDKLQDKFKEIKEGGHADFYEDDFNPLDILKEFLVNNDEGEAA